MVKVMTICVILVCLMAFVNSFTASGDIVKERFQESDIQALKDKVDKLERRVSRLEKLLGQGPSEKKVSESPKKQMEKEMHERLNISK